MWAEVFKKGKDDKNIYKREDLKKLKPFADMNDQLPKPNRIQMKKKEKKEKKKKKKKRIGGIESRKIEILLLKTFENRDSVSRNT